MYSFLIIATIHKMGIIHMLLYFTYEKGIYYRDKTKNY